MIVALPGLFPYLFFLLIFLYLSEVAVARKSFARYLLEKKCLLRYRAGLVSLWNVKLECVCSFVVGLGPLIYIHSLGGKIKISVSGAG